MGGFFGSSGGGSNTQLLVMPTASKSFFDSKIIIQYKGTTTENYINGYFYKCIDTDGVYSWQQTYVQPGGVATVVKGVWTATGQTDYSTVPLPATKGWAYLVNGSATIDERTYTSGDLIVFNKDVASGTTVVTADLDFMNMDMVTKDNTITLTNKTINVDNNTLSNVEVDNFKTGVVQATVRAVGVATDTSLATEKAVSDGLATKVDKVTGKGLSTEDYTTAEKNKLATDITDVKVNGETVVVDNVAEITIEDSVPQVVLPLKQFNTVLSSNCRWVTSNDNFFFYSNGDVSADGKTVIKQNAGFGAEFSMTANNDYVIVNDGYQQASYFRIKIYTIATDGTLTLAREFARANGFNKIDIQNGYLFLYDGDLYGGGNGFYYIALADILNESISMTLVSGSRTIGISWDVLNEQYVVSVETGYYLSSTLDTIFSTALITLPDPKGAIQFSDILDGELILGSGDEYAGLYYLHRTVIGSGVTDTITLPITLQYQKIRGLKQLCNQYVMLIYNGFDGITYYYTATTLNGFRASTEGAGYQVAFIGSSSVITLGNRNILWCGAKQIVYNDFQKLGYSQLVDKTITNTDVGTSLFNKTANEFTGNNLIPANFLNVGDIIDVYVSGSISTASASPTNILSITFGGVELVSNTKAIAGNLSNSFYQIICKVIVRQIGTEGKLLLMGYTNVESISNPFRTLIGAEVEVDTTENNLLDLIYTWGTASESNTIISKIAMIEIKKQW